MERVARNEQAISDLRADIVEIRSAQRDDHHRLRDIEAAVNLLVESQKQARRAEETQYRRIELRLQALTAAVAFAGAIFPIVVIVTH